MSNNNLEVYNFQGNEGERVPEFVYNLVVNDGVQALPTKFCYDCSERLRQVALPNGLVKIGSEAFFKCKKMSEISIPNTVQQVGEAAFFRCELLKEIDFETLDQLRIIERQAFCFCLSLRRINFPSSVTSVGGYAFNECKALVQANLSNSGLTEISDGAFSCCDSLQTVSLPNTIERICNYAFCRCSDLVTVVVPLNSQSIEIGIQSFGRCRSLANLLLPRGSTAKKDCFLNCARLRPCFGMRDIDIAANLTMRFDDLPVHEMCYHHCGITPERLQQCITGRVEEKLPPVDVFGMNPFHIFFSTIEPRVELLEVLLNQYSSYETMNWRDSNGKRPLDYLMSNWSNSTTSLVQPTLQKWMVCTLVNWGAMLWVEEVKMKVGALLFEHDKEQRLTRFNDLYSSFERYEKLECISLLELVLWKCKLQSGWKSDGSKRQALDRGECRCMCGSEVVIPNVTAFL